MSKLSRWLVAICSVTMVFGTVAAEPCRAQTSRIDDAVDCTVRAIALMEAVDPGDLPPEFQAEFDAHRERTIRLLERAQRQMEETKNSVNEQPSRGDVPFEGWFDVIDWVSQLVSRLFGNRPVATTLPAVLPLQPRFVLPMK